MLPLSTSRSEVVKGFCFAIYKIQACYQIKCMQEAYLLACFSLEKGNYRVCSCWSVNFVWEQLKTISMFRFFKVNNKKHRDERKFCAMHVILCISFWKQSFMGRKLFWNLKGCFNLKKIVCSSPHAHITCSRWVCNVHTMNGSDKKPVRPLSLV